MGNGESTQETALAERKPSSLSFSAAGSKLAMLPQNIAELYQLAKIFVAADLVPRGTDVNQAAVAIMKGMEVGVSPTQAVANIFVVNNRPCMWGDLVIALIKASGVEEYTKVDEGQGAGWNASTSTFTVKTKRVGKPERTATFSMDDARRAGLDKKDTYQKWPREMCMWKALHRAYQTEYPDVLRGISIREVVEEYELQKARDVTPRSTDTAADSLRARLEAVVEQAPPVEDAEIIDTPQPDPPPAEPAKPAKKSRTKITDERSTIDRARERLSQLDDLGMSAEADAKIREVGLTPGTDFPPDTPETALLAFLAMTKSLVE